ncbi:MAG: tetratricopeptide repeat protein [Fibrobacterota bacterium]
MKIPKTGLFLFIFSMLAAAYIILPSEKTMGVILTKANRFDSAKLKLEKALSKNPKSRIALTALKELYTGMGNTAERIKVLEKLSTLYPEKADYNRELAELYEWQGDFDRAAKAVKEIFKETGREEHFSKLYFFYSVNGRYDSARELLMVRIVAEGGKPHLIEKLFSIYPYSGKTGDISIILKSGGLTPELLLRAADIFLYENNEKKAHEIINRFLKENKYSVNAYVEAADFYGNRGLPENKADILKNACLKHRNDPDLHLRTGRYLASIGKPGEASGFLESFLKTFPDSMAIRTELASLYEWNGNKNREIKELIRISKQLTGKKRIEILKETALRYEWLGNTAEALKYYEKALESDSSDFLMKKLARLYEETGETGPLIKICLHLYEKDPESNKDFAVKAAEAYEAAGRLDRTSEIYESLLKSGHETPDLFEKAVFAGIWNDNPAAAENIYRKYAPSGYYNPEIFSFLASRKFWSKTPHEAKPFLSELLKNNDAGAKDIIFLAEILTQEGKNSNIYYRKVFRLLKNKERKGQEKEIFMLAALRLGYIREALGEFYKTSPEDENFSFFLNSTLELLAGKEETFALFSVLDYAKNLNGLSKKETSFFIKDQAAKLQNEGRWDLANQMLQYILD